MRTAEEMYRFCEKHECTDITKNGTIKHFKIIENALQNDEEVKVVYFGLHNYESMTDHDHNHAYALTNKRILFARKKLFGDNFKSVSLDNVNDIGVETGMAYGYITIDSKREKIKTQLSKSSAKRINRKIQKFFYELNNKDNADSNGESSDVSVVEELKGLKELLDFGVLTEQEFEAQKQKILNA